MIVLKINGRIQICQISSSSNDFEYLIKLQFAEHIKIGS